MATVENLTYEQLFHPAFITGLVQRYSSGNNFFQRLFNMRPGDAPTASVPGKIGQQDLVDPSRIVGGVRNDGVGPHLVTPKSVGSSTVVCYRYYESINVLDEKLFPVRPLGGPLQTVDPQGRTHFAQQIAHLGERMSNLREFAISRMLQGGFDLKRLNSNDQNIVPVESGSGDYSVESGLPAAHKTQLALGTAGANLITADWSTASTEIASHCHSVNEAMLLKSGMPLKHIIVSTATYNSMRQNTKLQNQGGQVERPFENMSDNPLTNKEGDMNGGFTVRFRAMPQYLVHVYDGFLQTQDNSDDNLDGRDRTKLIKVVPDNYAYFLPEISTRWFGWQAGSEPVKKNIASTASEIVSGYDTWDIPVNDPPGRQVRMLDIGMPYLKMRESVMYAEVIGF